MLGANYPGATYPGQSFPSDTIGGSADYPALTADGTGTISSADAVKLDSIPQPRRLVTAIGSAEMPALVARGKGTIEIVATGASEFPAMDAAGSARIGRRRTNAERRIRDDQEYVVRYVEARRSECSRRQRDEDVSELLTLLQL